MPCLRLAKGSDALQLHPGTKPENVQNIQHPKSSVSQRKIYYARREAPNAIKENIQLTIKIERRKRKQQMGHTESKEDNCFKPNHMNNHIKSK